MGFTPSAGWHTHGGEQQWQSSTDGTVWEDIPAGASSSFTPGDAEVGKLLRARTVLWSNEPVDANTETVFSDAQTVANINDAPAGALTVDGEARQGATLTLADAVTDADGAPAQGRAYRWQVEGEPGVWTNVANASAPSFTPTQAEVGHAVRAVLNYTDGQGTPEIVLGAATAAVANVNDAPTGAVTLSGQAVRLQTITASTSSLADADGLGAVSLRWERGSADSDTWAPVSGATGATYTLGRADVGQVVRAVASWTDGQGTEETAVAATGVVAGRPILLPPPEDGEEQRNAAADEWTSTDLGAMLAEGDTFAPPAGVERVELADGVLSFGSDTAEAFVARLYLGLLWRPGDVGGLAANARALDDDDVSEAGLAEVFLSSAEYAAREGEQTDAEFVEGLYVAFLGRRGGGGERGGWTDAMGAGLSRAEVAASIADSPEARSNLEASTTRVFVADVEAIVGRGLYRCVLGREADAAGLLFWSDVIEAGVDARTLGERFAATEEFSARHGVETNEAFVESLYDDGLGRPSDAPGLQHWVGLINSGQVSRGEAAVHFSQTAEVRDGLEWAL